MIDELKNEVEKTLGRKISSRGDCELLAEDLYAKTGSIISYNTFRRLFGIIEFRKPRESTLDALSIYIGFQSYQDFTKRFSEVDTWPMWEHLYVMLSESNSDEILNYLHYLKRQQNNFSIAFIIVVRELLNRNDISTLLLVFRDPLFNFHALPYDEVAQIGVLIGLHFRNFHHKEMEEVLLLEDNFRDLVFKIFVDYGRLNGSYGSWIDFLAGLSTLDKETISFLTCLGIWRNLLNLQNSDQKHESNSLKLERGLHPILFGRIFGIKILTSKNQKQNRKFIALLEDRISEEPNFVTELLYEPALQALVFKSKVHQDILAKYESKINQIQFWYHLSQVAIHRVYQSKVYIEQGQWIKAKNKLDSIPFG
ncbi:hypothetical protein N9Y29_02035, partial [Crocinitomicaceae bacterium]|nr:hypothetical protein [Crocinitomicaceae bacterium]